VYAYQFNWGGIDQDRPLRFHLRRGHAAEISFFFGAEQGLFGYPFVPANEAGRKDLQDAMMRYLSRLPAREPNALSSCPPWMEGSSTQCVSEVEEVSNVQEPQAIVFDADFNRRTSQ